LFSFVLTSIFSEDETKIKELTSKLTAMKETLHMETQTLEHKNNELLKEKDYLVSIIYFYFFHTVCVYIYIYIYIFYYCKIFLTGRANNGEKKALARDQTIGRKT